MKTSRKQRLGFFAVAVVLLLCLICIYIAKSNAAVLRIGNHLVFQEEFALYVDLAKRDVVDRNDAVLLAEKAVAHACDTYALFGLAQEYGVTDSSFDFAQVQEKVQIENSHRQQKLSNGEVVMGLRKYTLRDYFLDRRADVKMELLSAIAEGDCNFSEQELLNYYQQNLQDYIVDGLYKYIITDKQTHQSKEITLTYREVMDSYHSLDLLAELLMEGSVGEVCDLGQTEATLIKRELQYSPPEECRVALRYGYVRDVYLPMLLKDRANQMETAILSETIIAQQD